MHEKLVRDGIPALAKADGRTIDTRTALDHELDRLLGLKLVEEAHELLDALVDGRRTEVLEELADLRTVIDAVAARKGFTGAEVDAAVAAKRSKRGGFDAGLVLRDPTVRRPRLHVGGATTLLDAIRAELQRCTHARLAVAFVMRSGTELLDGALRAALLRGADIRLLTTDYLDVTEPDALDALLGLHGRFETRVYSHPRRSFHPKAYLFERADGSGRAFVGSANLSRSGLRDGVEWTWTVLDFDAGQPLHELRTRFDELWDGPDVHPLSPPWIEAYRARRRVRPFVDAPPQPQPGVEPRPAQMLALRELERLRADGHRRALVVAATGLGKTFLAAFDARDAARVLFVAHREKLLRQAAAAFSAVYPSRSIGYVVDGRAELDRDAVFASVQTLSRAAFLAQHDLSRFDYVVVDEFHHAAADSYLRLLAALSPRFLLGLTATPFRGDHRDLMELCDGNLAYQVGLFEAIGLGWLVPFGYFGVADTVTYDDTLLTSRRTYDAAKLTQRVNTAERAARVIERFGDHGSQAALGFCVYCTCSERSAGKAHGCWASGIGALSGYTCGYTEIGAGAGVCPQRAPPQSLGHSATGEHGAVESSQVIVESPDPHATHPVLRAQVFPLLLDGEVAHAQALHGCVWEGIEPTQYLLVRGEVDRLPRGCVCKGFPHFGNEALRRGPAQRTISKLGDVVPDLNDGGHWDEQVIAGLDQLLKLSQHLAPALVAPWNIEDVQQHRGVDDDDRAHSPTLGLVAFSDSSHAFACCLRASGPLWVFTKRSSAPEVIRWPSGPCTSSSGTSGMAFIRISLLAPLAGSR